MKLLPGTKYMVVDCGGGTVDITVHEMESTHNHLRELYKATGGPYGSVGKINQTCFFFTIYMPDVNIYKFSKSRLSEMG